MSDTQHKSTEAQLLIPDVLSALSKLDSTDRDIRTVQEDVSRLANKVEKRTEDIQNTSRDVDKLKVQVESLASRMDSVEEDIDALQDMSRESATNKSKFIEQIIILFLGGFISTILSQLIH